ncbi:AzlD domain-containing protein [Brevibacillus sp. TJ4]|uniref:AzlD domain-containing protein n=1 Tax=Brevibacillus sp. TJ4 TaxID=3234853 RepID=UPI0037D4EC6B
MNLFWTYVLMSIATYLSRRLFLRLPDHLLSPRLKNGLMFIPVGIFAGLIFPSLFVQGEHIVFQPVPFVASLVCLAVMALSKNVFLSFGVSLGLVVLDSLGFLPWQ